MKTHAQCIELHRNENTKRVFQSIVSNKRVIYGAVLNQFSFFGTDGYQKKMKISLITL